MHIVCVLHMLCVLLCVLCVVLSVCAACGAWVHVCDRVGAWVKKLEDFVFRFFDPNRIFLLSGFFELAGIHGSGQKT